MSVHSKPIPLRSAAAVLSHSILRVHRPAQLLAFLKAAVKFPVEYAAARAYETTPAVGFLELFPEAANVSLSVEPASLGRHGWNVKLHEELYLAAIVKAIGAKQIFEIGTFDGGTTRRLAENSADDATVHTIDLPEKMFDSTQSPNAFSGSRVGEKYHGSPAAAKVKQIRHDATTFDFGPYAGRMDFVFVDAAHDYPHGLADSKNALKLIHPGSVIVWHDFEPYWSGLVHAICETTAGLPLRRLGGTSMAVLRT